VPRYLIDSDVLVYARIGDERAITTLQKLAKHERFVSVVTFYEVASGEMRARDSRVRNNQMIQRLFATYPRLPVTEEIALEAARRVRFLEKTQYEKLSRSDIFIAATALVHDLVLVSGNAKDFKALEVKKIVNWRNP
jgi:tRNA(fMet)-specific endonuclease VapC